MGLFVRQRLISHLSWEEPYLRSCARALGFLARGYGNASIAASYATSSESGQEDAFSSWFQRLKGVFRGKTSSETQPQDSESKVLDPKATLPGDFTIENFTDELKKARQFGSMTIFGRRLPRGDDMSAVKSLQRQEEILRAFHKRDSVHQNRECKESSSSNDYVLGNQ